MSIILPIPRERLLAAAALPENAGSAADALRHLAGLQGHRSTSTGVREAQGHKRGGGTGKKSVLHLRQRANIVVEWEDEALKVTLPLPHSHLSPNSRAHYRARAARAKSARREAGYVSLLTNVPRWTAATAQATLYFRTKRRRDADNALASLKAYFDGLADAGVVENDAAFTHLPCALLVDRERPRVVLTVAPSDSCAR